MFGSLDPAKILVILVLALVVLGPERLPKAARQLGAAWRELTRVREQVTEEVRSALPPMDDIPRIPTGSVSGFLRDLTRETVAPSEVAGDAEDEPVGHDPPVEPDPAWASVHESPSVPAASRVTVDGGRGTPPAAADDPGMN